MMNQDLIIDIIAVFGTSKRINSSDCEAGAHKSPKMKNLMVQSFS